MRADGWRRHRLGVGRWQAVNAKLLSCLGRSPGGALALGADGTEPACPETLALGHWQSNRAMPKSISHPFDGDVSVR